MYRNLFLCILTVISACGEEKSPGTSESTPGPEDTVTDSSNDTAPDTSGPSTPPNDMTEVLSEGQVRSGVVDNEAALFGGVSAEGQIGDFKIYNSRVQFIIEAAGESYNYVEYGGSLIDADIVRPAGQLGQDIIDDSSTMVGLGRMFNAEKVEVINDGSDGTAAIIRATGTVAPLTILTGTLESDALFIERDLEMTTDYILAPDSNLLKLVSTIEWNDVTTPVQVSDFMFASADVAKAYQQHVGYSSTLPESYGWNGILGQRNEIALALMQGEELGVFTASSILESVFDLGPLILGSTPSMDLGDGDQFIWARYIGVAQDMATLTDEWYHRAEVETQTVSGQVSVDDSAQEGVRVHILDEDGSTITMAQTDASGQFKANIPAGTSATATAESRGPGVYFDRKPGAGWLGPYNAASIKEKVLNSITEGATPIPFAPGLGISDPTPASDDTQLSLIAPGTINVHVEDGGPAMVRVDFTETDPIATPNNITLDRPSGRMAYLYIRDGVGSIPVEPGNYTIVVARGPTHEFHSETITVSSGDTVRIDAELEASVDTDGFWSLDPHSHASPSGDGSITMEGRLTVHAAHDVDVHFGTDHDNVADYRPLIEPLGLTEHLVSIIANEVSPTRRGHHNAYPLEQVPDQKNGGAFLWYSSFPDWTTTAELYERMRAMASDGDVIIQANHPTGSAGLFTAASYTWDNGKIGLKERWADDFEAFEVLNDGNYSKVFNYYLDLLNRGLNPTPVGVSDSHSHRGGVGENRTWVPLDVGSIAEFSNDHVRESIRTAGTVASLGPLLVPTINGRWAPGTTHIDSVDVNIDIRAPSWIQVDTVHVWENGTETQTISIEENTANLTLEPATDSVYVITVSGEKDMSPVYPGEQPWAAAQAFFIDVGGDGWTPPLPPLSTN